MMVTANLRVVLPHRGLAAGKSRLAPVLDAAARQALNRDLLRHTLATLAAWLGEPGHCIVVSPDGAALELASAHGAAALTDTTVDLNDAVAAGAAHAAAQGAREVLIVPGDLPLLDGAALDALAARRALRTTVIAPDRHGTGTNALLLDARVTRYAFGTHSLARHRAQALERGDAVCVCEHAALAFDLDTPDDWRTWARQATSRPGAHAAPQQQAGTGP